MVDTPALGAGAARLGGSSPLSPTKIMLRDKRSIFCWARVVGKVPAPSISTTKIYALYATHISCYFCAGSGTRTHTAERPGDFKSPMSTISSPRRKRTIHRKRLLTEVFLRPGRESNPRIEVLQTPVFPLHHQAGTSKNTTSIQCLQSLDWDQQEMLRGE